MTTINELHDDPLLLIFSHLNYIDRVKLSGVCRRWQKLSKNYKQVLRSQKAIGLVAGKCCDDSAHQVRSCDVVATLFDLSIQEEEEVKILKKMYNLIGTVFPGRYDIGSNAHKLRSMLGLCPDLRCLSLSYSRNITVEIAELITKLCPKIEHIDFSYSFSELDNEVWNILSSKLNKSLKHLELMKCSGITDESLTTIITSCTRLEIFSTSIEYTSGDCFSLISRNLKKLTLDIDEVCNSPENIIHNLGSGNGRYLTDLNVSGDLNLAMFNELAGYNKILFENLETLSIKGHLSDQFVHSYDRLGIILRPIVHQLINLKISFKKEVDSFFNNLFSTSCMRLKKLEIRSYFLEDETIANIVLNCPNLETISFNYINCSKKQDIITEKSFKLLSDLKNMKQLKLKNVTLDEEGLFNMIHSCKHLNRLHFRSCKGLSQKVVTNFIVKAQRNPKTLFKLSGVQSDLLNGNVLIPKNMVISSKSKDRRMELNEKSEALSCQMF